MSTDSRRRRRQEREHGCEFCRDFGTRPYGHLRVAAHDDDRGFALLVCPRCRALWQDNFSDDPVPIQPAVAARKWPWPRLLPAGRAVRLQDGSVGVIVGWSDGEVYIDYLGADGTPDGGYFEGWRIVAVDDDTCLPVDERRLVEALRTARL